MQWRSSSTTQSYHSPKIMLYTEHVTIHNSQSLYQTCVSNKHSKIKAKHMLFTQTNKKCQKSIYATHTHRTSGSQMRSSRTKTIYDMTIATSTKNCILSDHSTTVQIAHIFLFHTSQCMYVALYIIISRKKKGEKQSKVKRTYQ